MNVSSHVQQEIDFTKYRTFDWGPADALPTGDPRLDRDPFFRDHVQGAVGKGLAARGFTRASDGTPDLLIHYHANITQRVDVNRLDREDGYCYDADCLVRVFDVEAGTLVIDMVDARTHKLVWRGWADGAFAGTIDRQDLFERQVDMAVERILARFPVNVR